MTDLRRSEALRAAAPFGRLTTLAIVVTVFAVLHLGRDILMPLALALLVAFALMQPVVFAEKLGCGRRLAVGLVVGALILLLSAAGWLAVTQMQGVLAELPHHRTAIKDKVGALTNRLARLEAIGQSFVPDTEPPTAAGAQPSARDQSVPTERAPDRPPAAKQATAEGAGEAAPDPPRAAAPADTSPSLLRQLPAALNTVFSPIGTMGVIMLFAVYMMVKREDLRNRFIRLTSNGELTATTLALAEASRRIGRYLGMQVLINATSGLTVALGLYLLGVSGWALWGFLYCLLRFLPYVGPLVGSAMPAAMALAVSPAWNLFLATVAFLLVVEVIINLVLEPWLYGGSTGISSFAILVSAVVWAWLWGPIGLLLAMPLTVVMVVLGKSVRHLAFLDILLGTDEALSPADRYYQRVIANDPDEAIRILGEIATETPVAEILEGVLLPALTAADRGRAAGRLTVEEYDAACENIRDSLEALELHSVATSVGEAAQPQPGHIVCLAARSGACDVATDVLCRLLQRAGHACRKPAMDLPLGERLDSIGDADTVCLVSLPDPTLRQVRALCKRVKKGHPDPGVVVLAFGDNVDPTLWRYRSLADCSDAVATSSADVVNAVVRLRQARVVATTS